MAQAPEAHAAEKPAAPPNRFSTPAYDPHAKSPPAGNSGAKLEELAKRLGPTLEADDLAVLNAAVVELMAYAGESPPEPPKPEHKPAA